MIAASTVIRNTVLVSIRPRAVTKRYPSPSDAPTNSPTSAPTTASGAEMRNALKMYGSGVGELDLP